MIRQADLRVAEIRVAFALGQRALMIRDAQRLGSASKDKMISEEEALAAVLEKIVRLPAEVLPLVDSLGKFSARDLLATRSLPAFDNSTMDGYAVRADSATVGARLPVVGEQPAGEDRGLTMGANESIRIFTGAPIPTDADAVVMQEDVTREENSIVINVGVARGEFIRRQGSDLTEGQKILAHGEEISAALLGLLASQGLAEIEVGGTPRVAILSTGDELARPGDTPRPGQIFESNAVMLHALALQAGAQVAVVEHVPDDLDRLTKSLAEKSDCDVLIISGGVSVGERDFVKPALRALGAEIDLWRVALKPGKPFLFGRVRRCQIFGLPGNPVSVFVTFLKFVRPALRKMMGAAERYFHLPQLSARLAAAVENRGERPHYFRGELRDGVFHLSGTQESHALFGLSRANSLLRLAAGEKLAADALATVETWR